MRQHTTDEVTWFQFEQFRDLDGMITHGIFSRLGGVSAPPYATLNAGLSVGDDPSCVKENRARIIAALPDHPPLVTTHPVHGNTIIEITSALAGDHQARSILVDARADGMVTQAQGLGLFWAYADCTPMMLVDPRHAAISLVHGGWRGTSGAIVAHAIEKMSERFGTQTADLRVGIGPSIGPCCYEVDEPVRAAFQTNPIAAETAHFSTVTLPDGRESLRLDVASSNRDQLIAAGVPSAQIEQSDICTGCRRDLFFSHRMENSRTGRFAVVIALR